MSLSSRPTPDNVKSLSFEEAFDDFLNHREAEGASPKTLRAYTLTRQRWQEYRNEHGVPTNLAQLEESHIVSFIRWLRRRERRGQTLSSNSVSYYFRSLRAFLNWCVRRGSLESGVVAQIKPPKVEQRVPEILSEAETQKLLHSAEREVEQLVIVLLLDTGLRVSELTGLCYESVDWENAGIKVMGKGAKERMVTLSKAASWILRIWVAKHPGKPSDWLVKGERGRLTVSGVEQLVRRVASRAGLNKRVTPHRIRHTFATHYLQHGGNIHGLKDELGHSTLEMAKRYVHLAYNDRREVKGRVSLVQRNFDRANRPPAGRDYPHFEPSPGP